jgi:hypothetical protein
MYSNHKAPRKVSRRAVLGTAGVGALGAAAAGAGFIMLDKNEESPEATAVTSEGTAANAVANENAPGDPVVLVLENGNATKGVLFVGANSVPVENEALIAAVKQAAKQ